MSTSTKYEFTTAEEPTSLHVYEDLFGATEHAWNGKSVRIKYRDAKGQVTERQVTDIVFSRTKSKQLLMTGNDKLRNACRSYLVANIIAMELL